MKVPRLYWSMALALALLLVRSPAQLAGADNPTLATAIDFWHSAYPDVPTSLVWQMVEIESGGDPAAYNPSGASGVLQFEQPTWDYAYRMEMNDTSYAPGWSARRVYDPMDSDNIWSVWDQVHLTFYLLHNHFGCWWVSFAQLTGAC